MKEDSVMLKQGFDNAKYLETQSREIKQRIAQFGGKLYLEFGESFLMTIMHPERYLVLNRTVS